MKIILEIECTPEEARALLGLPDVGKLQEKWLSKIETDVLNAAKDFSPEELLKKWTAAASGNLDVLTGLLGTLPGASANRK